MNAGEIIEQIDGLTHDKLTYFVRAGYIHPKKIKRGSLNYNDFSKGHLQLLQIAWDYIKNYDMRVKAAFERADTESKDTQLKLWK